MVLEEVEEGDLLLVVVVVLEVVPVLLVLEVLHLHLCLLCLGDPLVLLLLLVEGQGVLQ